MKIRLGFVSNSSSASFVVALSILTDKEKRRILDYENWARATDPRGILRDSWDISEISNKDIIIGNTIMDNDDLANYLGEDLYSKMTFSSY
jgi:hypothetical protein